ncbi:MAG: Nif3-like dinuclear metal center hexameric protein [Firmicutes bacterium]|nr:Nif3-like dinuclear metal center hexameric protein [Bacillota bacterium]
MEINNITDLLENWFPLELAEDWDNSGLQIKPKDENISGIVIGLTLNNDIIETAINSGSNLIICHHPMFFNDEDKYDLLNIKSKNLSKLLTAKGIGFYALHTNFDKKYMADVIAELLGLSNLRVLDEGTSLGIIGDLKNKYTYSDFLLIVSKIFKIDCMKYSDIELNKIIEKVAICPGSGRGFLDIAIENSDVYLTGDINYHSFEKAVYFNYPLIDICHYNSEILGIKSLSEKIKGNVSIPVNFYEGKDFHKNFIK